MTEISLVPPLMVLADENLPAEFVEVIRGIGPRWIAGSGRAFEVTVEGTSTRISLILEGLVSPPSEDEIDVDLLELVGAVHDTVAGDWSAVAVQRVARAWGWDPHSVP